MRLMTKAQIAKATKDQLEFCGQFESLKTNHLWRIGYIYADIILRDYGLVSKSEFERISFDCLNEALEFYTLEQERWQASRQYFD